MTHDLWRRIVGAFVVALAVTSIMTGCSPVKPQAVTRVEVDATDSSKPWKGIELSNLDVVLDAAISERGRLVVAAIDGRTLAHDAQIANVSFAVNDGGNAIRRNRLVKDRRRQVVDAVTRLLDAPRPPGGSDIFGALTAAAQYLQQYPPQQPRRVVLLSDMMNNIGAGLDVTTRNWAPAEVLSHLRESRLLPDLHDVEVWVGGAGLTAGNDISSRQVQRVRDLWLAVLAACHARDVRYGTNLVEASPAPDGGGSGQ